MNLIKRCIFAVLVSTLVACGGGGGDDSSSTGNYAGTWDVSATRVINDCGLPLPANVTVSPLVNQDGTRVVVNSGTIVLTGMTNDEDGFAVKNIGSPDANGCVTGTAYNFKNASDGNADVGVALVVQCGNRQCAVGYGGQGVRRENRSLTDMRTENTGLADIQATIGSAVVGGKGEIGQNSELETAETLSLIHI